MAYLITNRHIIVCSLSAIVIACGSSTDGKTSFETGDAGQCLNGVCPGTGGSGTGASTSTGATTSTGGVGGGLGSGGTLATGGTTTGGGMTGTGGTVPVTCGNGVIDAGEDCDGSDLGGATCASATMNAFPSGFLSCTASCTFDLSLCSSGGNVGGAGGSGSGGTVGAGGTGTGCGAIACTRNRTCTNAGCTMCSASGFCQ